MARKTRAGGSTTQKKQQLRDDITGFLTSDRVDKTADYLRRGRPHEGLKDEALAEQWIRAFKAMADDPRSLELRRAETDLQAEFDLRGLSAPFEPIEEAVEKYARAVDSILDEMKRDPDEYHRVNVELQQAIDEFRRRRGRN